MNVTFRQLRENEIVDFIHLRNHVYPAFTAVAQDMEQTVGRYQQFFTKETVTPIGAYSEDQKLLGVMILFDFIINYRGVPVKTGGIGGVGVDLAYKKQHICRDMIQYGLRHFLKKEIYSSVLHPFRVDFYKKMGYGLLSPFYKYRVPTQRIPGGDHSEQVDFLNETDIPAIAECYNEHFHNTNGEIKRNMDWPKAMLKNQNNIVVGYKEGEKLMAYAICTPVKLSDNNFLRYDLKVNEMITLNCAGRKAIMGFLRNQADQFENVLFYTQDDTFYQPFDNPADESKALFPFANHAMACASTGLMFRILDTSAFFGSLKDLPHHEEGAIVCLFEINEPFIKGKTQSVKLSVGENGFCQTKQPEQLTISLSIQDFSAMVFGAVPLKKLVEYGLAESSDQSLMQTVSNRLFNCEKPVYHVDF
ncbi:MAG TPA: GNAT family N-acetyltransferase [Thermotogota bacterium]|nr:GNAT family N-acetyltransferase [Thermotogota bacterium]HRW35105.1 GNAT family N-acetyltransferase [Thermotogota bacterium]